MEKRGLNTIVSTALLILLAIGAVIIIWIYFKSALTDLTNQMHADCLTINIQPSECHLRYGFDNPEFPLSCGMPQEVMLDSWYFDDFTGEQELVQAGIERGAGKIKSTIDEIKIIFYLKNGNIVTRSVTNVPGELELKKTVPALILGEDLLGEDIKSIKIAPVLSMNGKKYACQESALEKECVIDDIYGFEEDLNAFWSQEMREAWDLLPEQDLVNATQDFTNTFVSNLNGNFVIEGGWNLNNQKSIGFILRDNNDFHEVSLWWWSNNLRAFKGFVPPGKDPIWGGTPAASVNLIAPANVDVRLSRNGNNFLWEYKIPPSPTWQVLHSSTIAGVESDLVLEFDEGAGQEIRYVKFQADDGFICKES